MKFSIYFSICLCFVSVFGQSRYDSIIVFPNSYTKGISNTRICKELCIDRTIINDSVIRLINIFQNVEILSLYNSILDSNLTEHILDSAKLSTVHISNSPKLDVETLLDRVGAKEKIVKVSISSCQIRHIPKGVSDFKHLEYLDLSNNQIREIKIPTCSNLTYLDVSGNRISNSNFDIGQCHRLRHLDISRNPFFGKRKKHELAAFTEKLKLTDIEWLNMAATHIRDFPTEIYQIDSLRFLNLGGNRRLRQLPQARLNPKTVVILDSPIQRKIIY